MRLLITQLAATIRLRSNNESMRASRMLGATLVLVCSISLPVRAQTQAWLYQDGTTEQDGVMGAAPDGVGGVVMSGYTDGDLGGTSAGLQDAWLARYDQGGNQVWIHQIGSPGYEYARSVAPDTSGDVFVCGGTTGDLGGPITGTNDAWLARYDRSGNQLWILQVGTNSDEYAAAVSPDGLGGVFVGGGTGGHLGASNAGGVDAWLARYNESGALVWIRQLGTSSNEAVRFAVPDGVGGVHVGGGTYGSLGGPNAGQDDAWLARYDSAGNQLWLRQIGTSEWDTAKAAAQDAHGGLYITGWTGGSLGGPNAGPGSSDAWIARYSASGDQLWVCQLGTVAGDNAIAAAPDGLGGVYVGGETGGALGGSFSGVFDAWIARFDDAGNQVWIDQFGSSGYDKLNAAAGDGLGGLFVGGETGDDLGGMNAGSFDTWRSRYDACTAWTYCEGAINSTGQRGSIGHQGSTSVTPEQHGAHGRIMPFEPSRYLLLRPVPDPGRVRRRLLVRNRRSAPTSAGRLPGLTRCGHVPARLQ